MATKRGITISFKNITKDIELYSILSSMEDKSNVLKQILYKVFVQEYELVPKVKNEIVKVDKIKNKKVNIIEEDSEVDVLNF